jgi:hypothetical protein
MTLFFREFCAMFPSIDERRLKLFVVGQYSSDPAEWIEKYDGADYRLILAYDAKQAAEMADSGPAIEVVSPVPVCL